MGVDYAMVQLHAKFLQALTQNRNSSAHLVGKIRIGHPGRNYQPLLVGEQTTERQMQPLTHT
jgi:hypothetical protein